MRIMRTYADHGRSGLKLAGRAGLRTLQDDVANRRHDFTALLVYDVSRWGRFQDTDESAYYEFMLKKVGIRIHYCVEQFLNDCSPQSILFKTLKRTPPAVPGGWKTSNLTGGNLLPIPWKTSSSAATKESPPIKLDVANASGRSNDMCKYGPGGATIKLMWESNIGTSRRWRSNQGLEKTQP
jgi:hypothetical protein